MAPDVQPTVTRLPPYLQTAAQPAGNPSDASSALPSHPRPTGSVPPHVRDPSLTRGRPPITTSASYSVTREPRAPSAQGHSQESPFSPIEPGLRRQLSNSYGHHRQTSVIHGVQHSRNPSFNSPQTSSPLSPESLLHASSTFRAAPNARRIPTSATEAPATVSSSTSPLGHGQNPSIDSTVEGSMAPLDGIARKRNGPPRRRGQGQSHSSVVQPQEPRTPGEYALHHLFHSFVVRADAKINQCLANIDVVATPVEQTCGLGADASFDQLITSLGHITRQNPKSLVDSLMLWRKAKGDAASAIKRQLKSQQNALFVSPSMPHRHTEPGQPNGESGMHPPHVESPAMPKIDPLHQEYTLADRRAIVSIYVLCRVLISIFEQSHISAITPDLALKLEDIVFCQLRDVDPNQLLGSSLRLANWRIYGQVLGCMSRLDFENVTERFTRQLDTWQGNVTKSSGTTAARDLESRIELLLLSMRNLHIPSSQEGARKSCEFLTTLGNLFADAHGPRIKQAYCQLLERLLIPVAGCPESFQNNIPWGEFISTVNSRLGNMLSKVRHWNSGFPLSILLFCISPVDTFMTQWAPTVTSLGAKLKDKTTRAPAIQALCQLTWTYLARVNEAPQTSSRRVEDMIKLTFPSGKKTHIVTEQGISDALVQLIRIIGFAYQDLCFRSIIFPLANTDLIQSSRDLRIESMEPEKIVISIRGFLALMADSENGNVTRPPFPVFNFIAYPQEGMPTSPLSVKPEFFADLSREPFMADTVPPAAPVNVSSLSESTRKYYFQYCEIVGKITIVCDNTFGGQASLNEKFGTLTPKTPIADAFSIGRREDALADPKQPYLELLHVAIQALPRCFTDHISLNTLINLLCTGSAHVEPAIAASAASSLKAVAKQGYAQSVAIAFPRFIFNYDMQYSTMSDEGRLGPAHIEATLALYLELLTIWIDQVKQKTRDTMADARDRTAASAARAVQLEMTNVIALVDEVEAYGLFFLCSQSRRVRSYAIRVLRLVVQFDTALGKVEQSRIINILEVHSVEILKLPDDQLSVAERSRLQKDKQQRTGQNTLIEICGSEVTYDAALWFKAFPNLVRCVFEQCPHAIALCRGFVCDRLLLMQSDVEALAKLPSIGGPLQDVRPQGRSSATPADVLIDQWKLYLIMACVTLSSSGAQSQSQLANAAHSRKTSRGTAAAQERLGSARALFSAIIPMLAAGPEAIRTAVVIALGSINRKLYRTLLESLQYAVITCNDEAKARINAHHRTPSSPQRTHRTERLRTEVTYVYKLTASFLRYDDVCSDDWILNNLVTYAKDLRIYLSDTNVQNDWRFQKLRYHYCGLVEETFEGIQRSNVPSRWMPFEARKSAFSLMEDWCGFSPESDPRRGSLDGAGIAPPRENHDRLNPNAAVAKEKNVLRVAALSAMATLCAGPISIQTESGVILSFNLPRMVAWIDAIFATENDKVHAIGRRALRLLLLNNPEHNSIACHAIDACYQTDNPRCLSSYFDVVAEVLIETPDYPIEFWRILSTVVFTLGSESRDLRMKSARLLRTLDERQEKSSNLQEFDISISDRTRAVYKLAQFEYSKRLASAHASLGFLIFSEFSLRYNTVGTDNQRNIVAALLPWLQTLELQVDSETGGPTAVSYMLLANMFEITICSSNAMHNEVQALWQALATGPHAGNVQLILDFIIYLCLERREQNFVEYAKQIVVYLSTTPAGSRVLEFFLLQLTPKNMVNDKKRGEILVPDTKHLPYVADLNGVLPTGNKQAGLSLGQVALIFLVDLMVPPVKLSKENATKVIHAVFILWDHYTPTVQEQAREMLVHQLQELVATKADAELLAPVWDQIEQVVESVRRNEDSVCWSYESHTGKPDDDGGSRVPAPMLHLAKSVVDIFSLAFENFSDAWAKEALHWASICPVRHLACRSFQVFRCISVTLDARMLADMLARLSNTIADEQTDYQTFSLEILTTLKVIIGALDPSHLLRYPQLFWTTCACLSTIHEREFYETLGMLEKLLNKLNLADPHVSEIILKAQPAKWEGSFEGLQALLYKGLRSADSLDRTLALLSKMREIEDCDLIGREDRFLFDFLANLPGMLEDLNCEVPSSALRSTAQQLAGLAQSYGYDKIYAPLSRFAAQQYRNGQELLVEAVGGIQATYFPMHDAESLIFMIGLLTNRTPWLRIRVMEILCELIPLVDMTDSAITSHGPDLISPLLRLLQTEHSQSALQVMDHIMEVSGNPMEKHHLRMSMASGSARAIRKEYERTKSLYGIPQSSGWSIPMPAVYSSMTRNNVHAVFYTCGDTESMKEKENKTPEVEFHQEEEYTDSYFPPQSRAETIRSLETPTDFNVSELVNTLDSLDDFFDDLDNESGGTPTGTSHSRYAAVDLHEHSAELYDEQTAPILHRSLNRAPSSASLHNGLADIGPSPGGHQRGQMSTSSYVGSLQTSFSSIDEISSFDGPGPSLPSSSKKQGPPALTVAPSRPGLHARSITSPANHFSASQPTPGAMMPALPQAPMEYEDGIVSDTENSPFPPLSATMSNSSRVGALTPTNTGLTPTSATEAGPGFMRRGMRRLTGGRSESAREKGQVKESARLRALSNGGKDASAPNQSPRVPRVPLEYLNANATAAAGGPSGGYVASPNGSPNLS
ncbi:uncharacterized protein HMPREF1541_03878 [Cyphellophora europaea CBS 101466]|uniref:Cell morphogenesis protein N-terminal domain-containing protein n=1 Tax=Cyphellophora europaea (strain CBS 101466) TaxID=1220924 RepID=W2S1W7_CYPE1|nr:uncharacterized protein HMPREF1541_03878 [Cyphellophora europaea CBS 101466]ETN41939.1 hypothetical protein HMPREF1541_03878 [Cyphellophora europaea CBS 101466]